PHSHRAVKPGTDESFAVRREHQACCFLLARARLPLRPTADALARLPHRPTAHNLPQDYLTGVIGRSEPATIRTTRDPRHGATVPPRIVQAGDSCRCVARHRCVPDCRDESPPLRSIDDRKAIRDLCDSLVVSLLFPDLYTPAAGEGEVFIILRE